ncbi:ALB3L3 [Scenedesmus sp. PABB004]|nr:ALB3L3 [Scenedesmus sp. PABB004]
MSALLLLAARARLSSAPWQRQQAAAGVAAAAAARFSSSWQPQAQQEGVGQELLGEQLAGAPDLGWAAAGAAALDALHAGSGLPWWAAIPATTLAVKVLLLPVSLKQAKIVRTNMVLWAESSELERQRQAREAHAAAAAAAPAAAPARQQPLAAARDAGAAPAQQAAGAAAAAAALQQLLQWQRRVATFHDLRRKCAVPHPAWFVVNQLLQWPVFIYLSYSVRSMAQAGWPGFASEGALWFRDLTLPALVLGGAAPELPMGLPGLVLPLAVTGVMLTSIRIGFRASGAASRHPSVAGTWLAPLLAWLPPLLYGLTLASTYIKLQLPQAALLHWLASSSFTLALQLGLRRPRVRAALGYAALPGGGPAAGGGGVDPAVAAQAAAVDSPDVLVVIGAKHAALQRYAEAEHCLARALSLDPGHARAHYSAGQVAALQQQWPASESHYRRCAELAAEPAARAQAQYCVGVACHQQGRHRDALAAFAAAGAVGGGGSLAPMLALGRARALRGLGQAGAAAAVARDFLASPAAAACPAPVLEALRDGADDGGGSSGDGGGGAPAA